jgi:hypothetical protein
MSDESETIDPSFIGPLCREIAETNHAPRLCKDCRWAELVEDGAAMFWSCAHRMSTFLPLKDLVIGRPQTPRPMRCMDARHFGNCGVQGRYWERR